METKILHQSLMGKEDFTINLKNLRSSDLETRGTGNEHYIEDWITENCSDFFYFIVR